MVLPEEVAQLRTKGAVRIVPPVQERTGFYRTCLMVPKKDGAFALF